MSCFWSRCCERPIHNSAFEHCAVPPNHPLPQHTHTAHRPTARSLLLHLMTLLCSARSWCRFWLFCPLLTLGLIADVAFDDCFVPPTPAHILMLILITLLWLCTPPPPHFMMLLSITVLCPCPPPYWPPISWCYCNHCSVFPHLCSTVSWCCFSDHCIVHPDQFLVLLLMTACSWSCYY